MGAGIAQVLADVGKYNVTLADVTDKALANGQGIIAKSLSRIAKKKMADKSPEEQEQFVKSVVDSIHVTTDAAKACLLYTSPSPRDATLSRMPSSA